MSAKDRLPRIIVTCEERIPSVELGAIIPLTELQKRGLCTLRYRNTSSLSLADLAWSDILFIVRGASSASLWAATQAKKLDRIVLGYWDDDLLGIPVYAQSYPYFSRSEVRSNMAALFGLTDAFFSPSPRLASKLAAMLKRPVQILPEPLETEDQDSRTPRRQDIPTIGYSGSMDGMAVLESLLGPALAAVAATSMAFKVHVIGAKPNFIGKLPVETIHTQFIQSFSEYASFTAKLDWDIGLAPQMDSEFTNYKYHTKLLQYAHIGCAGIYSRVEIYNDVIQDGVTGLLVDNTVNAWTEAILRLMNDPDLRSRIANNALEYVQSHHNRALIAKQYTSALEPFLSHRAPRISKANIILTNVTQRFGSRFGYLRAASLNSIRTHGMRHFLGAAFRHSFSMIGSRMKRK